MLDIKRIKEDPEKVKAGLRAKEVNCDQEVDRILALDKERRDIIHDMEQKKAEQNKVSKTIPQLKKAGEDTAPVFQKMSELKGQIAAQEETLRGVEAEYRTLMLSLPNLPDDDLKPGGKENNEPLRYFGEPHKFDFEAKHHVDLCTDLGLIDYTRGVKLAGSGFWMYTGLGARLEWALLNYFIDSHLADGYEFILPPHMLEYQCGETAGQFPKFADEVYKIQNPTDDRILLLTRAIGHLVREAEHYRGFVRFADYGGVLVGQIAPKNRVLPLLRPHFCQRLPEEAFLLHDETHREGLFYAGGKWKIRPVDRLDLDRPSQAEAQCQALWRKFYATIAIPHRHNPKLQQTHLPQRFRGHMTEFQPEAVPSRPTALP